ncbi:response regulator [Paenibacillus pini]|uniref:Two-component response regulator n=1 Tax=Paenibacillus pini JCM 16418 TaxID=1236976 RepID=W7YQT2_9BACL|nr:response regulator [Paenibacillus pini]GAF06956.1 two-component response regulator [Paenibacillus pini JCM 16418]
MHQVLLIDDEPGAIKTLKYLLDWNEYGFQIAGEAANGKQALELLNSKDFSLVISDIKMPVMDGLELVKEIRKFSRIPIIMMSGYAEFEYVKKCLEYGVKDYLLKPVDENEFLPLFQNIKLEIERLQWIDKQLYHGMQAMRDQILKKWTHGWIHAEDVVEHFPLVGMSGSPNSAFCVLKVHMEFMDSLDIRLMESDVLLKRFAVRNIIEDVIGEQGYAFEENHDHVGVLLIGQRDGLSEEYVRAQAEQMRESIGQFAKVPVTIGVGSIVHTLQNVVESFHRADKMLDMRFLFGKNSVLSEEAAKRPDLEDSVTKRDISHIIDALKWNDTMEASQRLEDRWRLLIRCHSEESMKAVALEMFVDLYRVVKESVYSLNHVFATPLQDFTMIMEAKTMEDLFLLVEERCLLVADHLNNRKQPQASQTIGTVKKLAQEQFAQQICLKHIAEQVYMNPTYLGRLFKSEEGISFNEYLMKVRMEKAKTYLRNTSHKIYSIALEVGYTDVDWFCKKFKQYTGVSAGEFRSS